MVETCLPVEEIENVTQDSSSEQNKRSSDQDKTNPPSDRSKNRYSSDENEDLKNSQIRKE